MSSNELRKNKKQHKIKRTKKVVLTETYLNLVVKKVAKELIARLKNYAKKDKKNKNSLNYLSIVHTTEYSTLDLCKMVEKTLLLLSEKENIDISLQEATIKNMVAKPDEKTFIKPDWWFLWIKDKRFNHNKIILISEAKIQWTNDKKKVKQPKGNAIERLWKNLSFIRTIFKYELQIPFIVFGSWCDFKEWSAIRDRVIQMNDGFALNKLFLNKVIKYEPVSMYFQEQRHSIYEMASLMLIIALNALSSYGYSAEFDTEQKEFLYEEFKKK